MRINGIDRMLDFEKVHPVAHGPLSRWCAVVKKARWSHFVEVRETFGSASPFRLPNGKNVVIFDIGGNRFRLIAFVQYQTGLVVIRKVLTHDEYDTNKWKDEI
jgi:mRNA interferase HigB